MWTKRLVVAIGLAAAPIVGMADHEPACEAVVWSESHGHYHCTDVVRNGRYYDPSLLIWLGASALAGHSWLHDGRHWAYAANPHGGYSGHGYARAPAYGPHGGDRHAPRGGHDAYRDGHSGDGRGHGNNANGHYAYRDGGGGHGRGHGSTGSHGGGSHGGGSHGGGSHGGGSHRRGH